MYGESITDRHKCKKKQLNNGVVYENRTMKIFVLKNKVQIKYFSNEKRSSMILQEGEKKQFKYETKYLTEKFTIFTTVLDIYEKNIKSEYELYLDNDLINKIKLDIREG